MGLRLKLVLILLFVGLAPQLMSALSTLSLHQSALEERAREAMRQTAERAALLVRRYLDEAQSATQKQADAIRWGDLTDEERTGALWLLYRSRDEIGVVALLDAQGEGIGEAVYTNDTKHPSMTTATLVEFASHIPFQAAKTDKLPRYGAPFGKSIALAVPLPNGWVLALGMSLDGACRTLEQTGAASMKTTLVGEQGTSFCAASLPIAGEITAPRAFAITDAAGEAWLVDMAPAGPSFAAAVAQREADVLAPQRAIRRQTLLWIVLGGLAAIATAVVLGGSVIAALGKLSRAAEAIGSGRFDHRVDEVGNDELAALSVAFNRMAGAVNERDAQIRGWNKELEARVEAATRDLKEAQAMLLRAEKVAAMTALGAGVAHEINNPLAGALGLAQVLKAQTKKKPELSGMTDMLDVMEAECLRIKQIVATLLSLSQSQQSNAMGELRIEAIIDTALASLDQNGLTVVRDFAANVPELRGNRVQLEQAFSQLFANSRTAMPKAGTLTIATSLIDDKIVKVTVTDTGVGIAPENLQRIFDPFFTTKQKWQGQGLGMTTGFRVMEAHAGIIHVASKLNEGTTVTLTLPVVSDRAHLV